MDIKKLGMALLKEKKIDKKQLQSAINMYEKIGGNFPTLLVKLGYVSDEDVTSVMGKLAGVGTVDIGNVVIPKKLMESIPRDVIEKHNVIPVSKKEDQITLAMTNINDYSVIEEIQFLTNCRVEPIFASRESIRRAIIQFYHGGELLEDQKKISKPTLDEDFLNLISGKNISLILALVLMEKGIITKEDILNKIQGAAKKS